MLKIIYGLKRQFEEDGENYVMRKFIICRPIFLLGKPTLNFSRKILHHEISHKLGLRDVAVSYSTTIGRAVIAQSV
jgi:hypothetical protein